MRWCPNVFEKGRKRVAAEYTMMDWERLEVYRPQSKFRIWPED